MTVCPVFPRATPYGYATPDNYANTRRYSRLACRRPARAVKKSPPPGGQETLCLLSAQNRYPPPEGNKTIDTANSRSWACLRTPLQPRGWQLSTTRHSRAGGYWEKRKVERRFHRRDPTVRTPAGLRLACLPPRGAHGAPWGCPGGWSCAPPVLVTAIQDVNKTPHSLSAPKIPRRSRGARQFTCDYAWLASGPYEQCHQRFVT
jgi:hypothetical protein